MFDLLQARDDGPTTFAEPGEWHMIEVAGHATLLIAVVVGGLMMFLASRNFYRARLLRLKGVSEIGATEIPLNTTTLTRLLALNLLALLISLPLAVQVDGIFRSRSFGFAGLAGLLGFIGIYALALGGTRAALWAWKVLIREKSIGESGS